MRSSISRPCLALLVLGLLCLPLSGMSCNQSTPVISNGMPVTNEAIATAGRVAKTADLAAAAAVRTLNAGIGAGLIPREVGQRYVETIAPKVQASLDGLRAILQQQNVHPGTVTAEQLVEGMRVVLDVVSEAQAFVAQHQKATTP